MRNKLYSQWIAIAVLSVMMLLSGCSKPKYYVFKTVRHKPPVDKNITSQTTERATETEVAEADIPTETAERGTTGALIPTRSFTASAESKSVAVAAPKMEWVAPAQAEVKKMSTFQQVRTALKLKKELRRLKKEWNLQGKVYDATGDTQESSGKSQVIALLLVVLVGIVGAHRFYLGYTTIGIIQLLTLGGCGIWSLIDLIRIITGDLKPIDGEYEETL